MKNNKSKGLVKVDNSYNNEINNLIKKIDNCLNGENKIVCAIALIERISYIIVNMNMDIDENINCCASMIKHYTDDYKNIIKNKSH